MVRAVLIGSVVAVTLVAVAAGGSTAAKQRVAIDGKFTPGADSGTFTFVPLTAGALKGDSGKFTGTGNLDPSVVRSNGQRVTVIVGTDSYVGVNGTLGVSQRLVSVAAGRNYNAVTGTWKVISGTGAYEGYKGGGTFAAAQIPSGPLFFREEGYLTKP
jgi:hypothetical protein